MTETIRLLTRKADLGATVVERLPPAALEDGQARLKIDKFALTTNNITYAAFGDAIGYWKVFPAADPALGAMPVWGFADVVESRADGVEVGTRVWGYLPVATELVITPARITRQGFVDAAPHRRAVPAVYSRYVRCDTDPHYRPELEAQQALYRPLFITSYTAVDFLRDAAFFGAKRIIISSASSKTAYGVAWCLKAAGIPLVGVTGARNRAFVEGLGCYDTVIGYDDIEGLPADIATLYVDLASEPTLRARIHHHLGAALVHDCLVGSTQADAFPTDADLPGPPPRFFFAAERLDQHRDQGTIHAFLERFEADQLAFIERAGDPAAPWITIVESQGPADAAQIIRDLADGKSDPALGHMVRL